MKRRQMKMPAGLEDLQRLLCDFVSANQFMSHAKSIRNFSPDQYAVQGFHLMLKSLLRQKLVFEQYK